MLVVTGPLGAQEVIEGDEAPEPEFDVFEYRVDGVTALDHSLVERAVYPFLGENKTFVDVDKARLAVETLYRDAGYSAASVSIPEQTVDYKIVRLSVMGGRAGAHSSPRCSLYVRTTGCRGSDSRRIRHSTELSRLTG